MKYTNSDVKALGTILGIWAHPDDEAFVCSGLLNAVNNNGQRIVLVTATKGGAGQSADELKWPTADLADIRAKELEKSLKYIGKIEHHWLDYPDGSLAEVDHDEAVSKLVKIIDKICPDTILTFEPEGITGHNDHKAVYRWAKDALNKSSVQSELFCACENTENYEKFGKQLDSKFNIYFGCDCPSLVRQDEADICYELSDKALAIKLDCLKAHSSQTEQLFKDSSSAKLVIEKARVECFIKDKIK